MDWNDPERAYGNGRMGGMRPDPHASVDAHINYNVGYQQFVTEREEADRAARARWSSTSYSAGGSSAGGYSGSGGGADGAGELLIAIIEGICTLVYQFVEWYGNAKLIWQWLTCAGLLGGWTFVTARYLWPLAVQFAGSYQVRCVGTVWIWLALGIIWVPLNRLVPRMASALIFSACIGSLLTWKVVLKGYLLPNLVVSDFALLETVEVVLWIWVGFGILFYPITQTVPRLASWIAPIAWTLAIIPWGEVFVRVIKTWVVQQEYGQFARLRTVVWIWLGVVVVFPLVSKISRCLTGLLTVSAYALLPYVLVAAATHSFGACLSYIQTTENVWGMGLAILGCIILSSAVATFVAVGIASFSVRVARILGLAFIWTIGPMSSLAWIDVPWRFFSQWFGSTQDWMSSEAAVGIAGWILWLFVFWFLAGATYEFHKNRTVSWLSLEHWFDDIKATETVLLPRDFFGFLSGAPAQPSVSAR